MQIFRPWLFKHWKKPGCLLKGQCLKENMGKLLLVCLRTMSCVIWELFLSFWSDWLCSRQAVPVHAITTWGGSYFATEQVCSTGLEQQPPGTSVGCVLCLLFPGLPGNAACRGAVHHAQGWLHPRPGWGLRAWWAAVCGPRIRFACLSGQGLACKTSSRQKEGHEVTACLLFTISPYLPLEHFFFLSWGITLLIISSEAIYWGVVWVWWVCDFICLVFLTNHFGWHTCLCTLFQLSSN